MTRPQLATTRDWHLGEAVSHAFEASAASFLEQQTREQLAAAIDALPSRERTILSLYSYEDLTIGEIGEVLTMCDVDVILLLDKAFGRLQVLLAAMYCRPR